MREIKFRGKRIDGGEWVYGWFCEDEFYKPRIWFKEEDGSLNWHEVDPATVGQFTGLRDENGVEVYEGDWTEASWGYSGLVDMEGIMYAMAEGTISDDIIVCSNIHDTPEPWKEESDV